MKRRDLIKTVAATTALAAAAPFTSASSYKGKMSVENTPVILEVAINGSTTKARNPAAPETPAEISAEVLRVVGAGATIVHSHSNRPNPDVNTAAQAYIEAYTAARKKYPDAILYATANFDPEVYPGLHSVWPGEVQCGHHRVLAEKGISNMVLMDMGVVPLASYNKQGLPSEKGFMWYGFWPEDSRTIKDICDDYGTGASISVFEPGWMKNVLAMVRAGSLPRGSKLNIYFAPDSFGAMAPPIPEALEMYLKMIEGLDLKWSVGVAGGSVMDTPLAQMALERGGSFRVGLEDWGTGPSNLEQMARAKELINAVGRPIVTGKDALKYLDIPYKTKLNV